MFYLVVPVKNINFERQIFGFVTSCLAAPGLCSGPGPALVNLRAVGLRCSLLFEINLMVMRLMSDKTDGSLVQGVWSAGSSSNEIDIQEFSNVLSTSRPEAFNNSMSGR